MSMKLGACAFVAAFVACACGSSGPLSPASTSPNDGSTTFEAGHDASDAGQSRDVNDAGGVSDVRDGSEASETSPSADGALVADAPGLTDGLADSCAAGPGGGSATIHTIGRFDTSDPAGPKFSWPGSTIAATFTGTGISAQLSDSVGSNSFAVVVDGAAHTTFATQAGTQTYALASGLASGQHTLSLVKRTESYDGIVQLLGLMPTGGALVASPEPYARRIELIGDSITCGYGILGGACKNPSVDEEDWTQTAGALVASELHAEATTIAYSGIGMYRNYNGDTTNQMPTRFLLTLADVPTSTWAFATPQPDVVVIDLGTNDFATNDPGTAFQTAYTTFLQQELRVHYPSAYVIVALSPMLSGTSRTQAKTYLTNVVSAMTAAGDHRVVYFEYDVETSTGCQSHPDVATNQAMAAKIVPVIEQLTGWCP
jgi:lysophospholipase L1-like esterase